jgi:GT2 family glycosyltransferase
MYSPSVSLIVLNWNGRSLVEACLDSLQNLDYPDFSIVVVDNASTDDSVSFIERNFPQVVIHRNEQNLGYAGGNNVALRRLKADIAVLINLDVVVSPDWLRRLIAPMMTDQTIGVAGCKLYYPDGRLQHAGGYITYPQAFPGHYGLDEEDSGSYDAMRDSDYVIGAVFAVRREALDKIGLLDEGFFLYYEDVDYCWRARRANYRVVYVPEATAVHLESATTHKGSLAYIQRFHTGRWRFLLKHFPVVEVLSETVPAEHAWLHQCALVERQAAVVVYRQTLKSLPAIWAARLRDGAGGVTAAQNRQTEQALRELCLLAWQLAQQGPSLDELERKAQVQERPFVSRVPLFGPLIARFREAWNNVSTKWYIRPLLAQQNYFNHLLVRQLRDFDAWQSEQQVWLLEQDSDYAHVAYDVTVLSEHAADINRRLVELDERLARSAGTE